MKNSYPHRLGRLRRNLPFLSTSSRVPLRSRSSTSSSRTTNRDSLLLPSLTSAPPALLWLLPRSRSRTTDRWRDACRDTWLCLDFDLCRDEPCLDLARERERERDTDDAAELTMDGAYPGGMLRCDGVYIGVMYEGTADGGTPDCMVGAAGVSGIYGVLYDGVGDIAGGIPMGGGGKPPLVLRLWWFPLPYVYVVSVCFS